MPLAPPVTTATLLLSSIATPVLMTCLNLPMIWPDDLPSRP